MTMTPTQRVGISALSARLNGRLFVTEAPHDLVHLLGLHRRTDKNECINSDIKVFMQLGLDDCFVLFIMSF